MWNTPITVNGLPSSVISLPIGSESPNSCDFSVSFTMISGAAPWFSDSVKLRPGEMSARSVRIQSACNAS